MGKPNYQFVKRAKEAARKQQKEEKRQRKLERSADQQEPQGQDPEEGEPTPAP